MDPNERPRDRRRRETEARIVDAALDVVTTEGIEALTVQRLAHDLGYAVGALYRYYASKDAIVVAAQHRVITWLRDQTRRAMAAADAHASRAEGIDAGDTSLLRILLASEVYRGMASDRPGHFGMISCALGDPRRLVGDAEAAVIVPVMMGLLGDVASAVSRAVQAGALDPGDSSDRAFVLWGSLHGIVQLRKLDRFALSGLSVDTLADELVRTLLRGWGAGAAPLSDLQRRARRVARRLSETRENL